MAEVTELRDLSPEQVVEAANGVLAAKLHIDDPAEAARRLVELAKLDPGMTAEIEALARDAARSDPELLGEFLGSALNDLAESEPTTRESIRQAAQTAGEKQTVVGLDILALGFILLCGYIAVKGGGVESEEKTVKISEQKDGSLEITIGCKKKNINPMTAVGTLLRNIWAKDGG